MCDSQAAELLLSACVCSACGVEMKCWSSSFDAHTESTRRSLAHVCKGGGLLIGCSASFFYLVQCSVLGLLFGLSLLSFVIITISLILLLSLLSSFISFVIISTYYLSFDCIMGCSSPDFASQAWMKKRWRRWPERRRGAMMTSSLCSARYLETHSRYPGLQIIGHKVGTVCSATSSMMIVKIAATTLKDTW